MQREAIDKSVRILKDQHQSDDNGLIKGQARGRIILPCGTGKTRISLRIVERLTEEGELSIVLCPSIALVAQIRREYLQHTRKSIRALAVCSDITAGYDPKKESSKDTDKDPTADISNVSAAEVKGKVTTDPAVIAEWISHAARESSVNVIFGTYQSAHRIAKALDIANATAKVLIADEAHRTAGLRRNANQEQKLRDFTICHDNEQFPAIYRIYQTATPRVYGKKPPKKDNDLLVRDMDDEAVFGVDLYRRSYIDAVRNGWLSDYRIIAIVVNDRESYEEANRLANNTKTKGRRALTTADYMRGLAFALTMAGTAEDEDGGKIDVTSCIAFMNTVDKSKNMAQDLQTKSVRDWVQKWLEDNYGGQKAADYTLEHIDATHKATVRENAKLRLAEAEEQKPYGIINVGIFGEGTDSPSLNAVAFLEPRRSPIDVIQAVGRAMRTAPGKKIGYIICPIVIPPGKNAETWLSNSPPEDGWKELGDILLALRAHDSRIEDKLGELMYICVPKSAEEAETTMVAVADPAIKAIRYGMYKGEPDEAYEAVRSVVEEECEFSEVFASLNNTVSHNGDKTDGLADDAQPFDAPVEPTVIITAKKNKDGSIDIRDSGVVREKRGADGMPGKIDVEKSKDRARDMINKGGGRKRPKPNPNPGSDTKTKRQTAEERAESKAMMMLKLSGLEDNGNAIKMNLLHKSGLTSDRVMRDLNILERGITEASHHLRADELQVALNKHFGLHNLKDEKLVKQADGCTIAALLMMNAAMLHQRIADGNWMADVPDMSSFKNRTDVVAAIKREWEKIMDRDFRPILEPAVAAVRAVEETGKTAGLVRALHHTAWEAEEIAATYADMGADHAGPLFNKVMGNQSSDGAFFTRPTAASIAARLALDACGDQDWADGEVWERHKVVDIACGSGTLLAAVLTDMKRRAKEHGASEAQIRNFQKNAVENTIKGLDINPVSLQLAASQLTAGNEEVRYSRMGLYQMPYGPLDNNPARTSVGTLELIGQESIVPLKDQLNIQNQRINAQIVWEQRGDTNTEDAATAVRYARIVIMNPPFTNRVKMGEKFTKPIQDALRQRADALEKHLVRNDEELTKFVDKNSISPLFIALADKVNSRNDGVLTMIAPTIALTAPSGQHERKVLARRFHIHTVLTSHQPGNVNMSQHTGINESIVVMKRHKGPKPPTRFINLDRLPTDEAEVQDLHHALSQYVAGSISNGWGEVSEWSAERMERGDWTAAIWRSPELAEAAANFADNPGLHRMVNMELTASQTGRELSGRYKRATKGQSGAFPVIKSKGADGQKTIRSQPDEYWVHKEGNRQETQKLLQKASHLLITSGQNSNTARLTAVADERKYIGDGYMPIKGVTAEEAKAIAVFVNSTAGRLQLMRHQGRTLVFPIYRPKGIGNIRIPDIKDQRIRTILAKCWEDTKDVIVPQFRDGECEVRRLWDEAVADAMGWDPQRLAHLRNLLNNEPHVRGLGYEEYTDEYEEDDDDHPE